MPKMSAVDAAVLVLEREGVSVAFGVPGAAINPLLRRSAQARLHPPYSRAPRRGRLAHGRRLYAGEARQYRGVHRHLGPGRHRHDHRPLRRRRRLDPDPLHHRPGAAGEALQGRLPGHRHRVDRQACGQMGGDRARAGARADGLPAGVPRDALRPSGAGADRSADRRADGRDRIRHRDLPASAGLQAGGDAGAGAARYRDVERVGAAADRRGRRRHQRRRQRPPGGVRRAHRRSGRSRP